MCDPLTRTRHQTPLTVRVEVAFDRRPPPPLHRRLQLLLPVWVLLADGVQQDPDATSHAPTNDDHHTRAHTVVLMTAVECTSTPLNAPVTTLLSLPLSATAPIPHTHLPPIRRMSAVHARLLLLLLAMVPAVPPAEVVVVRGIAAVLIAVTAGRRAPATGVGRVTVEITATAPLLDTVEMESKQGRSGERRGLLIHCLPPVVVCWRWCRNRHEEACLLLPTTHPSPAAAGGRCAALAAACRWCAARRAGTWPAAALLLLLLPFAGGRSRRRGGRCCCPGPRRGSDGAAVARERNQYGA